MKFGSDGEFTCEECDECSTFTIWNTGVLGESGVFLCCQNCGGLIGVEIINEHASRIEGEDRDYGFLIAEAPKPASLDPRGGG